MGNKAIRLRFHPRSHVALEVGRPVSAKIQAVCCKAGCPHVHFRRTLGLKGSGRAFFCRQMFLSVRAVRVMPVWAWFSSVADGAILMVEQNATADEKRQRIR